jgi:ADP-heptose:LPS heptosyltransferase
MGDISPRHVVLSRTDSIGDVMLTLPMAGLLRHQFPSVRTTFLGRGYTAPVLRCCRHVDQVLTKETLQASDPVGTLRALDADLLIHVFPDRDVAMWARKAGIPMRIGTAHRWWHWATCTHKPAFSRRRSALHEAQLNLHLLAPLGITRIPSLAELAAFSGFTPLAPDAAVRAFLKPGRRTLIVHPLSKGSAVEWGLDRFGALIGQLDPTNWQVVVTGTEAEAARYRSGLPLHLPHVVDAGGRLSLDQLIALIGAADALVAASTGPLHIAAACGIRAIGLYSPKRPIHPGRWAPIGDKAIALVASAESTGDPAADIRAIAPEMVVDLLLDQGSLGAAKTSTA